MRDIEQFYRRQCSIPCTCSGESEDVPGKVVDLSFDGALITQSTTLPPLGSNLLIRLGPSGENISLEGQVVYVQPQGPFGVKFSGACDDNLEKLKPVFRNYIEPELERPRSSLEPHALMLVK